MADIPTSLTQAVSTVKTAAASLTSGVSALPGGMSAIASVVNNASGALNAIPGVGAIAGALGSVGALVGAATNGLDILKAGGASLSALATTGLSPAAAAQMNSAIAALSSGGAVPIKLPTVATGTFDRGEMASQMASVFGSTKIPAPNFSGVISAGAKSSYDTQIADLKALIAKKSAITDETLALTQKFKESKAKLADVTNNYPQGDPQIAVVMAERDSLLTQISAKMAEYDKLK